MENTWLNQTLSDHADARYRLVFGHHPVHPVKGHFGPHELGIVPEDGREFRDVLARHRVLAYVCGRRLMVVAAIRCFTRTGTTAVAELLEYRPRSARHYGSAFPRT